MRPSGQRSVEVWAWLRRQKKKKKIKVRAKPIKKNAGWPAPEPDLAFSEDWVVSGRSACLFIYLFLIIGSTGPFNFLAGAAQLFWKIPFIIPGKAGPVLTSNPNAFSFRRLRLTFFFLRTLMRAGHGLNCSQDVSGRQFFCKKEWC